MGQSLRLPWIRGREEGGDRKIAVEGR